MRIQYGAKGRKGPGEGKGVYVLQKARENNKKTPRRARVRWALPVIIRLLNLAPLVLVARSEPLGLRRERVPSACRLCCTYCCWSGQSSRNRHNETSPLRQNHCHCRACLRHWRRGTCPCCASPSVAPHGFGRRPFGRGEGEGGVGRGSLADQIKRDRDKGVITGMGSKRWRQGAGGSTDLK